MERPDPTAWRVCAVVVTHNPDPALLPEVLAALAPQVECVLLLDNASARTEAFEMAHSPGTRRHVCRHNRGLAWAQNLGARWAWRRGFDAILTMDQDSVPAAGMVASLLRSLAAECGGRPVAAIGPRPVDAATGRAFPIVGMQPAAVRGVHGCRFLISSGMLISRQAWRAVGPMAAAFFIDHVDTEWCLRARALGWRLLVDDQTSLAHRLGDGGRWVWLGRRRWLPVHRPFRHYYMVRNALWLARYGPGPLGPRVFLALRSLAVVAFAISLHPSRAERLGAAARALRDGLSAPPPGRGCGQETTPRV